MAEIDKNKLSKGEWANKWDVRLAGANRVYSRWANRFQVSNLYQYYEGYQWMGDTDINNRPYVVNLIYSTIDEKLPNLLFENPLFNLRPHPIGTEFDFDSSVQRCQTKEDILNYVIDRDKFNLNDKHELAVLDAMFGFGVMEIGYSKNLDINPYINTTKYKNPLDYLYCKHIPFDRFRVASNANWDLSTGKWWGYFEFVPESRLKEYSDQLNFDKVNPISDDSEAAQFAIDGKISVSEDNNEEICPSNHIKIYHLWDFEIGKYFKIAPDSAKSSDQSILEFEDFDYCGICTLRYGKRRKGWYPLPPVFNWISPQDEINDIRQTQKIHRKRYSRKYQMLEGTADEEEVQKFLYGPDGQMFKVSRLDGIKQIEDAPLDTANQQSMIVSYDDFLRVAGGNSEQGRIADRTTATQANINNQSAQVRTSKDLVRVANFMVDIGQKVLKSLKGNVKEEFWAKLGKVQESLLGEIKDFQQTWKKVDPSIFEEEDYEIDVKMDSVSPIYQQKDKTSFMEFLALISQYEILAFSPALLREAAYRTGYKNSVMLKQFQQMAQLASLGKMAQLKQQVTAINMPQGAKPGQLPQQQVDASTPPDNQSIMNMIFNKQGVQQTQ